MKRQKTGLQHKSGWFDVM